MTPLNPITENIMADIIQWIVSPQRPFPINVRCWHGAPERPHLQGQNCGSRMGRCVAIYGPQQAFPPVCQHPGFPGLPVRPTLLGGRSWLQTQVGPGRGIWGRRPACSDQAEPRKRLLDAADAQWERVLSRHAALDETSAQLFPSEAGGFLGLRGEEGVLLQRRWYESALLIHQRAEGQGVPLLQPVHWRQ